MSIEKKKQLIKLKIQEEYKGDVEKITRRHALIDKMHDSNIPFGYWFLKMRDFDGSPILKDIVDQYINNIDDNYMVGKSYCFAGNQGTGKTMSSICILKEALKKGYTAFYITAADLLNDWMDSSLKSDLRRRLKEVDFLFIDELDSRFFISDSTKELFSGIYENTFRHRAHNTLPSLICTNETDQILNVFYGAAKQSIDSLNNQYLEVIPFVGKDHRKKK